MYHWIAFILLCRDAIARLWLRHLVALIACTVGIAAIAALSGGSWVRAAIFTGIIYAVLALLEVVVRAFVELCGIS
jgi:hypothetical protein